MGRHKAKASAGALLVAAVVGSFWLRGGTPGGPRDLRTTSSAVPPCALLDLLLSAPIASPKGHLAIRGPVSSPTGPVAAATVVAIKVKGSPGKRK